MFSCILFRPSGYLMTDTDIKETWNLKRKRTYGRQAKRTIVCIIVCASILCIIGVYMSTWWYSWPVCKFQCAYCVFVVLIWYGRQDWYFESHHLSPSQEGGSIVWRYPMPTGVEWERNSKVHLKVCGSCSVDSVIVLMSWAIPRSVWCLA